MALNSEKPCEMEYRLKRFSDQSYRWHQVRSVPMKNEEGQVMYWIGSATDVHERRTHEAQVAVKTQQLNRINQYLDDLVHSTAHDMRVPVARLQLLVDAFSELPPGERESLLPKFSRSVQHLDSTLRGLVQVIELQGVSKLSDHRIQLGKVVEDVLERYQKTIMEAGASVHVHNPQNCEITYVRAHLYTILDNVLGNALKHRHPHKKPQVHINLREEEGYLLISVQDNGRGIDMRQQDNHLFKPFHRINKQAEGLGMGLYVVKTILEKNGGYAEVKSDPETGTVFNLYLKEYSDPLK